MKKILEWLDNLIEKHHKCKRNAEIYSYTFETYGSHKILTKVEYRCAICDKDLEG